MLRSFIDSRIKAMQALCDRHSFKLPAFARWDEARYRAEAASTRRIREAGLGWNVVEFKPGAFRQRGLTLFTLRMGDWRRLATGAGRLYAKKAMMSEDGQVTPHHFHIVKTEDILNRGGARFIVELFKVDAEGARRDDRFKIQKDAETLDLAPCARVSLDLAKA
jgi:D-lyxose ketol-isomerase